MRRNVTHKANTSVTLVLAQLPKSLCRNLRDLHSCVYNERGARGFGVWGVGVSERERSELRTIKQDCTRKGT
jgi:hypothetical protein